MDFGRPSPRPRVESVVPMINVIFLLLVFFMMTATIVPPDPFDVTLPDARTSEPAGEVDALYVSGDGTLAYGALRDEAALRGVAGRTEPLDIRADARLPARELAELLVRLAEHGITDVRLRVAAR